MKPFNLEEYLKCSSKKLVTRDGRKARVICTDRLMEDFPICGLVDENEEEYYYSYTINGKHLIDSDGDADLFFAPEKKEGWINVYKDGDHFYSSMDIFKTKKEAEALSCNSCIATVKVEWEE